MKTIFLLALGGLSWQIAAAPLDFNPDLNCDPTAVVTSVHETSLLVLVESLPCVSQPVLHVDDGIRPDHFMLRRLTKVEPELMFDDVATFEDGVTASGSELFVSIKSAGGEALPAMATCRFCKSMVSLGDSISLEREGYTVLSLFVNSRSHIVARLENQRTQSVSFKDITFENIQVAPISRAVAPLPPTESVLNQNPLFSWFTERRLVTNPVTREMTFESGEGYLNPRLIYHEKPAIFASALNRVNLPWDHEVLVSGDRLRILSGVVRVLKLYVNGTVTASAAKVIFEKDGTTGFISLSNQNSVLELGQNTEPAARGPNPELPPSGREMRAFLLPVLAL